MSTFLLQPHRLARSARLPVPGPVSISRLLLRQSGLGRRLTAFAASLRLGSKALRMLSFCVMAAALSPGPLAAQAAEALKKEAALRSQTVTSAASLTMQSVDGVLEAVRQTLVSAQVQGAIVQLHVKAGDRVKTGQVLLRIDARAADQASQASEAQAQAARASLHLAGRELARQQQLLKQNYISQAAFDQAEAQYKSTQAQVSAQLAQLALSRTQGGFHTVSSPYDGLVADLQVALGDMAMPGRPLLTVYDPKALRVTASVSQMQALAIGLPGVDQDQRQKQILVELPGHAEPIRPLSVQLLPTVDAATHTLQLRLDLPQLPGAAPGMFARVRLPAAAGGGPVITVPATAIVRRAEMTGIYVLDRQGQPLLRQLRLGARHGTLVEVLSGLDAGERIALDPSVAARHR